jgi:hypothetical protein
MWAAAAVAVCAAGCTPAQRETVVQVVSGVGTAQDARGVDIVDGPAPLLFLSSGAGWQALSSCDRVEVIFDAGLPAGVEVTVGAFGAPPGIVDPRVGKVELDRPDGQPVRSFAVTVMVDHRPVTAVQECAG